MLLPKIFYSYSDYLENKLLLEQIEKSGISEREKQIMDLTKEGLTVREIGKRLGISHVRVVKLRKRLKTRSRLQ